jgi:hypothetical protein
MPLAGLPLRTLPSPAERRLALLNFVRERRLLNALAVVVAGSDVPDQDFTPTTFTVS